MSVLVIGEALVDMLIRQSDLQQVTALPGGGPYNAARTVGRLGVPVTFAGGLSEDAYGVEMSRRLAHDGVEILLPPRRDLLTTLAMASLDESGAATYQFYFAGTAAPQVTDAELHLPHDAKAVNVGTLGLVLQPMADAVTALVRRLPDDLLLWVDPNCRPAVITDRDEYIARLQQIIARADVVKVSGDDMDYLFPGTASLLAAETLLTWGARLVLLTDGPKAVHVVTPDGNRTVPVPHVEVVDSVGSGDAFGGGFLAFWYDAGRPSLADLDTVVELTEKAIMVASLTCQRPGAEPPARAELPAEWFSGSSA